MATSFQDILRMQAQQNQQAAQNQQSQNQSMGNLGQMGGKMFGQYLRGGAGAAGGAAGGASAGGAGATGFGLGQPLVSGGVGSASFAGGAGGAGAAGAGGAGAAGGGGMSALMSNPWTAAAAAILGGANYAHNKGISSWGDSLKGQAGGNLLDYYGGRDDGKTHGFMGKLVDQDKAPGQLTKAVTDVSELDFGNAWGNLKDGVKNIFKLNIF